MPDDNRRNFGGRKRTPAECSYVNVRCCDLNTYTTLSTLPSLHVYSCLTDAEQPAYATCIKNTGPWLKAQTLPSRNHTQVAWSQQTPNHKTHEQLFVPGGTQWQRPLPAVMDPTEQPEIAGRLRDECGMPSETAAKLAAADTLTSLLMTDEKVDKLIRRIQALQAPPPAGLGRDLAVKALQGDPKLLKMRETTVIANYQAWQAALCVMPGVDRKLVDRALAAAGSVLAQRCPKNLDEVIARTVQDLPRFAGKPAAELLIAKGFMMSVVMRSGNRKRASSDWSE